MRSRTVALALRADDAAEATARAETTAASLRQELRPTMSSWHRGYRSSYGAAA